MSRLRYTGNERRQGERGFDPRSLLVLPSPGLLVYFFGVAPLVLRVELSRPLISRSPGGGFRSRNWSSGWALTSGASSSMAFRSFRHSGITVRR